MRERRGWDLNPRDQCGHRLSVRYKRMPLGTADLIKSLGFQAYANPSKVSISYERPSFRSCALPGFPPSLLLSFSRKLHRALGDPGIRCSCHFTFILALVSICESKHISMFFYRSSRSLSSFSRLSRIDSLSKASETPSLSTITSFLDFHIFG